MKVSIIAAIDERGAIGYKGDLLYNLKEDLQRFKKLTMGHCIIMGRKTFESLPNGPLPDRINMVVTRDKDYGKKHDGIVTFSGVYAAVLSAYKDYQDSECFVIGGQSIYEEGILMANKMYITFIHAKDKPADAYFPMVPDTPIWERLLVNCKVTKSKTHENVEYLDITTWHREKFTHIF